MTLPIVFEALYKERVWGGRRLEEELGRSLPPSVPIGESWEIVDRSDAQSIVKGGDYDGLTLREIVQANPSGIMGPGYDPARPFPILVKWLDCRERLSLQVHPPAEVAAELGGEPKTENWYIAAAEPGAGLLVGLRRGVRRGEFERALREERLEECVHRVECSPGDSILVRSGRIHAIDGGNLILEIQQNSDTTYRVYDWGRVGLDGKKRDLHIKESLACIDFDDFEPDLVRPGLGDATLADCPEFRIRKVVVGSDRTPLRFRSGEGPFLLHVVEGAVRVANENHALDRGANALVPWEGELELTADRDAVVLVTDRFTTNS